MSNKFKDINTKNRTCYLFNDIINIENFDPNNIKIDEKSYKNTFECLIDIPIPPPKPPLVNFSIFFRPGHSYSNPLPINYWAKFPTQTNFLKQYFYADFFAILQKKRPVCIVLCFVCLCKEVNTLCFVL